MPNDLQLSDQDGVLLESLVLAASDNVARAPASDRDQYAPERRRAFVETSGAGNVYLGTGSAWVDVSENTGLLSKLFSGGDGDFDSVNTDDALNKEIGDGIDYLDPRWMARSGVGFYHINHWTGFNNWGSQFTTGSGSTQGVNKGDGVEVSTGTTADSKAIDIATIGTEDWTWDEAVSLRFKISPRENFVEHQAVSMGLYDQNNYTTNHVGAVFEDGTLKGTVGDGSAEAQTTLDDNPSISSPRDIRADFTPAEKVEFYVDGVKEGKITSALPSGGLNRQACLFAENATATDGRLRLFRFTAVNL